MSVGNTSNATAGNASNAAEADFVCNADLTVLGFTFDPTDNTVLLQYSILNLLANSCIPLPIAGLLVAVSSLLYGVVNGLIVNAVSTMMGVYLSLWITRSACRPYFVRMLGRYARHWEALDEALTAEGYQIALLIRVTPVMPMVLINVLLSMTSISQWTYGWTTLVGLIPANLPYAYGAQLGMFLTDIRCSDQRGGDPVMLTVSIIGFIASIVVVYKVAHTACTYCMHTLHEASRMRSKGSRRHGTPTHHASPSRADRENRLQVAEEARDRCASRDEYCTQQVHREPSPHNLP